MQIRIKGYKLVFDKTVSNLTLRIFREDNIVQYRLFGTVNVTASNGYLELDFDNTDYLPNINTVIPARHYGNAKILIKTTGEIGIVKDNTNSVQIDTSTTTLL